jgi:hypothetical protein
MRIVFTVATLYAGGSRLKKTTKEAKGKAVKGRRRRVKSGGGPWCGGLLTLRP